MNPIKGKRKTKHIAWLLCKTRWSEKCGNRSEVRILIKDHTIFAAQSFNSFCLICPTFWEITHDRSYSTRYHKTPSWLSVNFLIRLLVHRFVIFPCFWSVFRNLKLEKIFALHCCSVNRYSISVFLNFEIYSLFFAYNSIDNPFFSSRIKEKPWWLHPLHSSFALLLGSGIFNQWYLFHGRKWNGVDDALSASFANIAYKIFFFVVTLWASL